MVGYVQCALILRLNLPAVRERNESGVLSAEATERDATRFFSLRTFLDARDTELFISVCSALGTTPGRTLVGGGVPESGRAKLHGTWSSRLNEARLGLGRLDF